MQIEPDNSIVSRRECILREHVLKYVVSTAWLIGTAYFSETRQPEKNAKRFLEKERKAGFLEKQRLLAHPFSTPRTPLFEWQLGTSGPNASSLKHKADKRWDSPLKPVTVYVGTRQAANSFGGYVQTFNSLHLSHDLFCTAVYLETKKLNPGKAEDWLFEGAFASSLEDDEKPGDARLFREGSAYKLIEILGRYSLEHIESIHPFCEAKGIEYEIW